MRLSSVVTQQIYTTDDPTKHGKLTGLGSSVGESAPRISFIVSLLDELSTGLPTELPRPDPTYHVWWDHCSIYLLCY